MTKLYKLTTFFSLDASFHLDKRVHFQPCKLTIYHSQCTHSTILPVHQPLWAYNTIQHNTIQYNTIQYNTTQYDTIQYNTIQYNTIQYNTIQHNTIQYNTIQYNTIRYNTIQYNKTQYNTPLTSSSQQLCTFPPVVSTLYKVLQILVFSWQLQSYNRTAITQHIPADYIGQPKQELMVKYYL